MGYRKATYSEGNHIGRCGKGKKIKYVQIIEWKDKDNIFHRRAIIHRNIK